MHVQGSGSGESDDDTEAARLQADEAKQLALNKKQAEQEASLAGNPELLRLLRPFAKDKCACHQRTTVHL